MTGVPIEGITLIFGVNADGEPVPLQLNVDGTLSGVGGGGGPSPYTSDPQDVSLTAADPGSASLYSKGNHRHKLNEALLSLANLGEKAYASLTGKPTIPVNSDFTLTGLSEKAYTSLTGTPTIPVNSDFTLTGLSEKAYSSLTGKPTVLAESDIHLANLAEKSFASLTSRPGITASSSGILSARPAAGTSGSYYFATDDNGGTLYYDNGAAWAKVASPVNVVDTSITSASTWKTLYINGAGAVTELSLGAAATYFRSGGVNSAPSWVAVVLGEIAGDNWKLPYTNGSGTVTELAVGAAGTYVRGNGVAAAPSFAVIAPTELVGGNWKILYTNGSGVVTELAVGTAGKYLRANGVAAAPTFSTPAPTELVGNAWKTLYTDSGGVINELSIGAAATVLASNGASAAPSWQSPSGWALSGEITPSAISSTQNDYAPTGFATNDVWRISADSTNNRIITGLSASQVDGTVRFLLNVGATYIRLQHNSGGSSTSNRFSFSNSFDFLLFPGQYIVLRYSGTTSRWIPVAGYPGPMPFIRLAVNNATQAITSNTAVQAGNKLSFDTVSASEFWLPVPTPSITDISMPYDGIFRAYVHDLDWGDSNASSTGWRALVSRKNDGAASSRRIATTSVNPTSAASSAVISGAVTGAFASGDTLQFYCIQNSGGTLNVAMNDLYIEYTKLGAYTFSGTN